MHLALYAHPFDLEALAPAGGLARLRDLGYAEVALAVSYHDGRWLMPWHPGGVVRFLEDGVVHFRPRSDYGALRPQSSGFVPEHGPSPLERFCAEAATAGVGTRAWTVGTHNTRLGERHPEACVTNAFGDRLSYALCPAAPAVQHYLTALVNDLAAHRGLQTIELEAFGAMGWKHSSHHDKASFTPSGLLDAALSACFCSACRRQLEQAGADPEALAGRVRTLVQQCLRDGDAMAPLRVPGNAQELAGSPFDAGWLEPMLGAQRAAVAAVAARVVAATPHVRRAVQVHPHPWFRGSQLAAGAASAYPATDERVLTCYGDGLDAIGKALASDGAKTWAASPRRVSFWPKAPQFQGDDDLRNLRALCERHGVGSLAVYHLGLLPWRTLERVAKELGR